MQEMKGVDQLLKEESVGGVFEGTLELTAGSFFDVISDVLLYVAESAFNCVGMVFDGISLDF